MRIMLVASLTLGGLVAVLGLSQATHEGEPHDSPTAGYFGLSPTRSADGRFIPAFRLGNSDYCGHCHTEIFHEWNASTHHFSSFNNPVYRRVALDTATRRGAETLKFCAGCHDPLPLLAGELPSKNENRWSINAGITCLACHRITEIHSANGGYTVAAPTLHPFALSDSRLLQGAHRMLLNITPWLHRSALSKPFYGSAEYCATCHTLVSPKEVNGETDLVLQNEYGHWANSRFSSQSGLSAAGGEKRCVDCHMPLVASHDPAAKNGRIRSHRFPGGNTVVPALNRDDEQLNAVENFLTQEKVKLRCVGARRNSQQMLRDCGQLRANNDDVIELDIEVVNQGVGHTFPGGTIDSNEAWLEVTATDAVARTLFQRGRLKNNGDIDATAHFFGAVFVDKFNRPTDRRTATTEAVAVASSNLIPAHSSRRVRVRFRIPPQARLPVTVVVKLNWRKFPASLMRWVFAGKPVPTIPVTVMDELRIQVEPDARDKIGL